MYDYGFRIYNPGIAKFLSVDPLAKSYPMLTPYQFASNTPIQAIDLDGLEAKIIVNSQYNSKRIALLMHSGSTEVERNMNKQQALSIAWYSTDKNYDNDAHTRMYPDINFPTHGKAATLEQDNSFEGVQVWGLNKDGNPYLLATFNNKEDEMGLWESFGKFADGVFENDIREATDLEKIISKNFSQDALRELKDALGSDPIIDFLKEKGVVPTKTLTGLERYQGPVKYHKANGDTFIHVFKKRPDLGAVLVEGNTGGGVTPIRTPTKEDSAKFEIK